MIPKYWLQHVLFCIIFGSFLGRFWVVSYIYLLPRSKLDIHERKQMLTIKKIKRQTMNGLPVVILNAPG